MFKHILVPIDGSEASRHAAQAAAELARVHKARLTALHVAPPYKLDVHEEQGVSSDFVTPDDYTAREKIKGQAYLAYVAELAAKVDVAGEGHVVLSGDPAEAIVEAAGRHGCDTIVMGTHGHTGIKKMLLGSVAQKVLVNSTIPVLVTR
jgi:nucleotide-binding universal stress UspA family protein